MPNSKYLTSAETAKLIRQALKKQFPGQKFSVKSSGSGGSINVRWVDGPTFQEVNAITSLFSSRDFDASIDMDCYIDHWLMPDGSVTIARNGGTEDSLGYIPAVRNAAPSPDAVLVSFGSSYVFCSRDYSAPRLQAAIDEVDKTWHLTEGKPRVTVGEYDGYGCFDYTDAVQIHQRPGGGVRGAGELAYQILKEQSFYTGA